jgi:D-alanyl-D-alanine dipeptidase
MPHYLKNSWLNFVSCLGSIGILTMLGCSIRPSTVPKSKYTTFIPEKSRQYLQKDVLIDSLHMINLNKFIPNLNIEIRYAGNHNFMHTNMYPAHFNTVYVRKPVAIALKKIQQILNTKGLSLKVWDAYRPYAVTVAFWNKIHDVRYVANPAQGSGHNRGIAVDVTLVYLQSGMPLDMGTDFDNFTDSAHTSYQQFSEEILSNRKQLKEIMTAYGFQTLSTEWWHYSWPNATAFPVLDIPLNRMKKIAD